MKLILTPKNSPNGEDIENIDPSPSNVNKSLQLVGRDDVFVGEVYEMLVSSFKTVLLLINTKRIQGEKFEKDNADPTKRTAKLIMLWHISACIKMRCQEHFGLGRA